MVARLSIKEAAAALASGRVVAVPTDTVYGLAASLAHPHAIEEIFALKQRPQDLALPVMIASPDQLTSLGVSWPREAAALAERWWPGALTIVVPVSPTLASRAGAADSLGLRIPDQTVLLELLRYTGPLAVTSANRHGQPPCETADEVLDVFRNSTLGGVVDGGRGGGVPSTVVRVSDPWRILRHGAVSEAALAALLGPQTAKE